MRNILTDDEAQTIEDCLTTESKTPWYVGGDMNSGSITKQTHFPLLEIDYPTISQFHAVMAEFFENMNNNSNPWLDDIVDRPAPDFLAITRDCASL